MSAVLYACDCVFVWSFLCNGAASMFVDPDIEFIIHKSWLNNQEMHSSKQVWYYWLKRKKKWILGKISMAKIFVSKETVVLSGMLKSALLLFFSPILKVKVYLLYFDLNAKVHLKYLSLRLVTFIIIRVSNKTSKISHNVLITQPHISVLGDII